MHASGIKPTCCVSGKKQVPLNQKELERARGDGRRLDARGPFVAAQSGGGAALALVADRGAAKSRRHARMKIGQMEEAPGDRHCDGTGAILRLAPDPGPSGRIMDVSAHVQLEKPRHPRERREPRGTNALHRERHDAEVRRPAKRVDVESARQRGLHRDRIDFPMCKKQMIPALSTDRPARGTPANVASLLQGRQSGKCWFSGHGRETEAIKSRKHPVCHHGAGLIFWRRCCGEGPCLAPVGRHDGSCIGNSVAPLVGAERLALDE